MKLDLIKGLYEEHIRILIAVKEVQTNQKPASQLKQPPLPLPLLQLAWRID